jgi:hypothetical protein
VGILGALHKIADHLVRTLYLIEDDSEGVTILWVGSVVEKHLSARRNIG